MVKVKYNEQTKEWDNLPDESSEGIYLDGLLKQKLDNVKKIIAKNWDCVILIDGKERSGKSTLGMTCGYYLSDTSFTINNFAKGLNDAIYKIKNLPDKSVLVVDEGSLVFNSRDSMKTENIRLSKILDVCGQKNMMIIIILPTIFNLNRDIATRRSRFLLHIYHDEQLNRGRFAYFGESTKHILYELGKKNYGSYTKPDCEFQGRFTDFKPPFYEEYIKLKRATLDEALSDKPKITNLNEIKTQMIEEFKERCPEITLSMLCRGFGLSTRTFSRHRHINEGQTNDMDAQL